MKIEKFWVATKPGLVSELGDICFPDFRTIFKERIDLSINKFLLGTTFFNNVWNINAIYF